MQINAKLQVPAGLVNAGILLSEEIIEATTNAGLSVEGEAKRLVDVDTGTTRSAINSVVVPLVNAPTAIVSAPTKNAPSLEFGSKPHTPPREPVFRWANKKGLNPWGVWQHIRKYGTKAHPFMRPALENKKAEIIAKYSEAIKRFIGRLR